MAAASLVRVGLVLLVRLRLLVLLVGDDVDRRPRERREGGVLGLALPEEKARERDVPGEGGGKQPTSNPRREGRPPGDCLIRH